MSDRCFREVIAAIRACDPDAAAGLVRRPLEQLVSVLALDQWRRWQAGERVPAEAYFREYPQLRDDPERALYLIYGEFLVRESLGEGPDRDEYLRRFPALAARLADQFKLHGAMGTVPGPSVPPTRMTTPDMDRPLPVPVLSSGSVPGYEILGELGRGGMGVVYQARQKRLNRRVALKMLLAGSHAGDDALARFAVEAEAVARLQHANIVQIHEVGEHHGLPFFSLEFVEGGSLAQKLAGDPPPGPPAGDAAARLVRTLARAMHAAHQKGIVHRDLKPANVLLTADGTPKITDFGLAKLATEEGGQTRSGAILGTPSYMAPEQAAGRVSQVGPWSDVYSLGAILYELLTGRPPFQAATSLDTLVQVLEAEPVPPARINPQVPRDLELICLQCLEKAPPRRYASAAALADDLDGFLLGGEVKARRPSPWHPLVRWARREPALVAGLAMLAACGVIAQVTSQMLRHGERPLNVAAMGILLLWALAAVLCQRLMRKGVRSEAVRFAWAAADVVLLTAELMVTGNETSVLVSSYLILVAGAGLRFRVPLIWFTTALSALGYGLLLAESSLGGQALGPPERHFMFLAGLVVMGFTVAYHVRRVRVLGRYYDARQLP
jgi:serine/threonine-protein kinase